MLGVELQRLAQRLGGPGFIAQAMLGVAHHGHGLGVLRGLLDGDLEEFLRIVHVAFAEKRAAHLKHEFDVVAVAELEDAAEALQPGLGLPDLEQHFAESGERVFVFGVEDERFFEGATGPGELITRQAGIAHAHVQLDGVGVEPESLAQQRQRIVVVASLYSWCARSSYSSELRNGEGIGRVTSSSQGVYLTYSGDRDVNSYRNGWRARPRAACRACRMRVHRDGRDTREVARCCTSGWQCANARQRAPA